MPPLYSLSPELSVLYPISLLSKLIEGCVVAGGDKGVVDGGWRGLGRSNTWTVQASVGAMTTEAACDACGGNNDGRPGHELGLSEVRAAWHGSARVSESASGDDLAGLPSGHRQARSQRWG